MKQKQQVTLGNGLHASAENGLISDLKATFPGLPVRPVREFGAENITHGVWTGADNNAEMPDGEPIFIDWHCEGYDGGVHEGFTQWLKNRGWYIENHDGASMLIIPMAEAGTTGKREGF